MLFFFLFVPPERTNQDHVELGIEQSVAAAIAEIASHLRMYHAELPIHIRSTAVIHKKSVAMSQKTIYGLTW